MARRSTLNDFVSRACSLLDNTIFLSICFWSDGVGEESIMRGMKHYSRVIFEIRVGMEVPHGLCSNIPTDGFF